MLVAMWVIITLVAIHNKKETAHEIIEIYVFLAFSLIVVYLLAAIFAELSWSCRLVLWVLVVSWTIVEVFCLRMFLGGNDK